MTSLTDELEALTRHDNFLKLISDELQARSLCFSPEEYYSVAEAIVSCAPVDAPPTKCDLECVATSVLDYFEGVSEEDAKKFVYAAASDAWGEAVEDIMAAKDDNDGDSQSDGNDKEGPGSDEYDKDDDGDYIGEGDCELCERNIKLTRHHLVPKATWPRIKKRLWNAAPVIEELHSMASQEEKMTSGAKEQKLRERREELQFKLEMTLGNVCLADLPENIINDSVREYLNRCALLCRQCHSAVHRAKTEIELATEYNTVERLLECEEVVKFAKWANKQHPGKHAR